MTPIKIAIVEDDLLIAESIVLVLEKIGYRTTAPCRTYAAALKSIEADQPDLILIDIVIAGKQDGIDLAETINKRFKLPFIFLTANSDSFTVNRAKVVKPMAYLVKPFSERDLFSSIEIAISNFTEGQKEKSERLPEETNLRNFIFIKEGSLFQKLELNEITHIESDNVYLTVFTLTKTYLIREKMDDFIQQVDEKCFLRIHRSYAININFLESINITSVTVAGHSLPTNKNYRQKIIESIKTFR